MPTTQTYRYLAMLIWGLVALLLLEAISGDTLVIGFGSFLTAVTVWIIAEPDTAPYDHERDGL